MWLSCQKPRRSCLLKSRLGRGQLTTATSKASLTELALIPDPCGVTGPEAGGLRV